MGDLKYIMFEDRDGVKYPVIFSNHMNHIDVARAMFTRGFDPKIPKVTRSTAGFIDLFATSTHGFSESMGGVKADPNDRQIINSYPYQHGINVGMDMGIEKLLGIKHMERVLAILEKK